MINVNKRVMGGASFLLEEAHSNCNMGNGLEGARVGAGHVLGRHCYDKSE